MKTSKLEINLNEASIFFSYREDSIGDIGVIRQIFYNQDYDITHWEQGKKLLEYHKLLSKNKESLIIDAGANIGASAVYFSKKFTNALVFSIEPDEANFELLKMNTSGLNVFNFKGAIADVDGEVFFEDPGRSDWGFMTKSLNSLDISPNTKKVRSISPQSILSHHSCQNANPLILKIDIEGGEEALVSGNTDWLGAFPLVIIELHDWMLPFSGSSRNFIKSLNQHDFDFLYRGENIFLFNRSILNFE